MLGERLQRVVDHLGEAVGALDSVAVGPRHDVHDACVDATELVQRADVCCRAKRDIAHRLVGLERLGTDDRRAAFRVQADQLEAGTHVAQDVSHRGKPAPGDDLFDAH